PAEVVHGPGVREAVLLDRTPARLGLGPAVLRQNDQSDSHRITLARGPAVAGRRSSAGSEERATEQRTRKPPSSRAREPPERSEGNSTQRRQYFVGDRLEYLLRAGVDA